MSPAPTVGAAYFGNRILRHVAADMEDLSGRGFTGVLHTFSENDLAHNRGGMRRIVEASHAAGLEVQIGPWGVAQLFVGEAESRLTSFHPELWAGAGDRSSGPGGLSELPVPDVRRAVPRAVRRSDAGGAGARGAGLPGGAHGGLPGAPGGAQADIRAAVSVSRRAGVDELWTWGYEACAHMSRLAGRDPSRVWEVLCDALVVAS